MERLNDIMGRTAQRRQLPPEQRSSQGVSQPGQRGAQSPQPVSRRPLPEQRARLGQPQYNAQVPMRRGAMGPHEQREAGYPSRYERRPYNPYHHEPVSQPTTYDSYNQEHMQRRPVTDNAVTPRSQPGAFYTPPPQSRPANDYYADNYAAGPHADVIDEWEEDNEDAVAMGYGDWEQGGKDLLSYKQTDGGIVAEPRTNYAPIYRERLVSDAEPHTQARVTRDLRDMRMPMTVPNPQTPAPQSRTQDMQHYRRTTQPLNPQVIADMRRGREYIAQEAEPMAKPQRLAVTRDMSQQPLPPLQPPRQVCSRCRGAGYLRADVPFGYPNFGKPIACICKEAEKKDKRRQQLRDMSNLDAFHNQSFKTFNSRVPGVQEACQASLNFAENPYGWLLLIGPNGCGKTHLAAAIANQSLDNGATVLFEAVPDLLDHLRAAFAPTATEVYDQLFSKMRGADLLVLNDLGAQQSSPWANEKLFQLLNHRYNMGLPTVITANPRGLQGIDERIRSRLTDNGLVTTVNLDRARDYRPNQPKRR